MSAFTRRHYEAVAKALSESKDLPDAINNLTLAFEADNPRFDWERFRAAAKAERFVLLKPIEA